MAQDFERTGSRITNSASTIYTSNSNDAIVGLRVANILTTAITMDVYVDLTSGDDRYLIKNASIPPGGSLELIMGGAKIVLQTGDVVKALAGTANGADAWISVVDSIST